MATLELFGFEDLAESYLRIINIPWPEKEKALNKMADAGIQEIRAAGESMGVRDPESDVHILDKLKKGKAKQTDSGGYIDVRFSGSRVRNGKRTRNDVIAFENEYGNRHQTSRAFVRYAMENKEDEISAGADELLDWVEDEFNR